ncbi:class I SAM-dependent methyltransferase [Pseudomonas mangrovi]|uniref:SAM-dependent methyltransferase n=1 Tax=Pseudomonas mangrovi TaxID=2161748 RepID=A0A2T5P7P0_9PSED|nr:class I SAM-dependent methyltransferase [Pseudomonas mangrovi]PTU73772.1 SAM-dependent methyltransferase [Pseudomonas mangrovi]
MSFDDRQVLADWQLNAKPWTRAVRESRIESRRLVTDRALLEVIERHAPASVLDLGCGEGWLVRELLRRGIHAQGIDGVAELVEAARAAGPGSFNLLSYEAFADAVAAGQWQAQVEMLVCNFSLIGRESVERLLHAAPQVLRPGGLLVVQTLHPHLLEPPYQDGWRQGSWDGCGEGFAPAPPWYFRTLGSWVELFTRSGLPLYELLEPLHPHSGRPASILFVVRRSEATDASR